MIGRTLLAASLLATLGGCDARSDQGPVVVSVIGLTPRLAVPERGFRDEPARVLAGAVAQGLVRFDATGQVEPGLAERWIVIDDGMSTIFRLGDARWSDGSAVTARQVVARLRAVIAASSRNPIAPYLRAIDDIVVMTPEVIEIRLRSPRPELLKLFAQPELALFKPGEVIGGGPYRIERSSGGEVRLAPLAEPDAEPEERDPRETVALRGERAALAIARFAADRSDLVSGGTFVDWPLLTHVDLPNAVVRAEPVAGLFGLAIVERRGLLASAEARAALAMAIDRETLAQQLGDSWQATVTLVPEQLDSGRAPALPAWEPFSRAERVAEARRLIAAARAATPGATATPLRLALPRGPGSNVLFGYLAADLRGIGLVLERVDAGADADLRLVDRIAPHDNARWYLAEACRPCGDVARFAIDAAREAPTMAERVARIAEADVALTADAAFVPLARPVRWSLVSRRLPAWMPNARGVHPLNHLRRGTN